MDTFYTIYALTQEIRRTQFITFSIIKPYMEKLYEKLAEQVVEIRGFDKKKIFINVKRKEIFQ